MDATNERVTMRAALIAGRWLMNRYAFFVTTADDFRPADHASPGITPEKALLFTPQSGGGQQGNEPEFASIRPIRQAATRWNGAMRQQ
ncbi:hypothetical protein [Permianibacter aggregans]|uniref:hypothetical protein n=1 Tax=Permianibacter aggregans TaxID=1510150 RepID=UPI001060447B|nr:hypothetical protein [Permianibacter aggregans]QGX40602.1 hypothetical protein E2H98_13360 [Permianibacter aggregans]